MSREQEALELIEMIHFLREFPGSTTEDLVSAFGEHPVSQGLDSKVLFVPEWNGEMRPLARKSHVYLRHEKADRIMGAASCNDARWN